jgi:hypothetical protein
MRLLLLFGLLVACAEPTPSADDDDADDTDEPTPSPPLERACSAEPTLPDDGLAVLVSDAHVHARLTDGAPQLDFALALLEEMNGAGVDRAVVLGPHLSDFGDVLDAVRAMEDEWVDIVARCPRLLFQLNGLDPADVASVDYVTQRLEEAPFAGVGAVDLRHPFINAEPDAPGLDPIYDLLEDRGLPFQFHGLSQTDPAFTARMLEIVEERPGLQFVWFGCPGDVLLGETIGGVPDNITCPLQATAALDCGPPCDDAGQAVFARSILGMDVGPAAFDAPGGPTGFDSFADAITDARARLALLPPDLAAYAAHERFDSLF